MLKMIVLPRQARDKHRESTYKRETALSGHERSPAKSTARLLHPPSSSMLTQGETRSVRFTRPMRMLMTAVVARVRVMMRGEGTRTRRLK
jgi:hypothetical protein